MLWASGNFQGSDRFWLCEIGDIEHLESVSIADKRVAELNGDCAGIVEKFISQDTGHFGMGWILQRDDNESRITADIGIGSGDGDFSGSVKNTIGVKGGRPV